MRMCARTCANLCDEGVGVSVDLLEHFIVLIDNSYCEENARA